MPVHKKVVENWKFNCVGDETNSKNEVTLIFCKTCREFAKLEDVKRCKKGIAKVVSESFVKGTSVVKKNNFTDHIKRSKTHATAVIRLSEKEKQTVDTNTTPSGAPKQTTLMPFVQRLNAMQRTQLTKKMQIAHFTAVNAKSFSFHGKLTQFCKESLKVS